MERAVAIDILMIDTAGRHRNKDNLMASWEKDWSHYPNAIVPEAPS